MDDTRGDRADRAARREAMKQVDTSSTKKRSAATHGGAGRGKKTRKTAPSVPSAPSTPSASSATSASSIPPARVDKSAEDISTQFHKTPATKPQASYTSLTEHEIIFALDMQKQIAAETRGVTRRNIPWDKFYSIYLNNFSITTQPKLAVESVKKIGEDNWEEQLFWNRLRQSLSDEVLHDLKLFYRGTKTLLDTSKDKEVASKFVLHVGEGPLS